MVGWRFFLETLGRELYTLPETTPFSHLKIDGWKSPIEKVRKR